MAISLVGTIGYITYNQLVTIPQQRAQRKIQRALVTRDNLTIVVSAVSQQALSTALSTHDGTQAQVDRDQQALNLLKAGSRRPKHRISLFEILLMAVETLWSSKVHTGLTMLGVIIGISSVIMITSIGQGVQKATELQIQALGTNVMLVSAAAARTGGISQGAGSASTLTWQDAQAIAKQAPAAMRVAAVLQRSNIQIVRGDINIATTVVGTDLNYPTVKNIQPQLGTFFRQAESRTRVVPILLI